MERQFPNEFPFTARRSESATNLSAAMPTTASPEASHAPEAMEIFTVEDPQSVPEAEEVFDMDAVETLGEADVVADAEAPLASPGLSTAARQLVTPLLAPLGAAAAVPVIVQSTGARPAAAATARPDEAPALQGAERRRSPRQALRAKAMYRNEADVTAVRSVQIVNLSLMGVRFRSAQAMAEGEKGNVRMEVGPVKWSSRVRVVKCEQLEDGYEIGCEFVTTELSPRAANLVNPLVWSPVKDKARGEMQAA